MKNILSHTFTFELQSSKVQSRYKNIIFINEADNIKHFVQYIQYSQNTDKSINLRHVNIKVDRSYYLEIANICIDNRARSIHFFSTLGKRRFGASNKQVDVYFSVEGLDAKALFPNYLNHYKGIEFKPFHKATTKYSTNEYRIYIQKYNDIHIVYLDQLNITSRKKIHKVFCVDITNDDLDLYNSIQNPQQKVDFIFSEIGKVYFRSIEETFVENYGKFETSEELAMSMLIKTSDEMEKSSRINENSTFRKIQEIRSNIGEVGSRLYGISLNLINKPTESVNNEFGLVIKEFKVYLEGIPGLKEVFSHLKSIQELSDSRTLYYLLSKDDQDFKDIILYILEAFSLWNKYIHAEEENIKAFNIASVDLADALRYFIDVCYKFNHEYKCLDFEPGKEQKQEQVKVLNDQVPLENIALDSEETTHTSAEMYVSEIDLDSEVCDELLELERDIEVFRYTNHYSNDMNESLVRFFEGYTKVVNTLLEFKDLSYSLSLLSQKLREYEIDENSSMLSLLIEGLISDLLEWKRSVLIEKTAKDIHFMDKSFYSNIAQIDMLVDQNKLGYDGGDGGVEFF